MTPGYAIRAGLVRQWEQTGPDVWWRGDGLAVCRTSPPWTRTRPVYWLGYHRDGGVLLEAPGQPRRFPTAQAAMAALDASEVRR